MNSWDCFDTLIARRFYYPRSIFNEVGKIINDPNFTEKRVLAEKKSKTKTYEEIYSRLPNVNPNIELGLELEHNFPIIENMSKVKDGDLILSDMYLPKEFVMKLLRNCGLTANVDIIVTPDGKKKGWIWSQVKEKYNIDNHYGDNIKSDVNSARKNQINGIHTSTFDFTSIEKKVYIEDTELACWMRYIRLQCPYEDNLKNIWCDQANYNLPILALSSLQFPNKKIAFTMRDCAFLQPLYENLIQKESVVLYSSRFCYENPTQEFIEYFKSTTENCVIVDLIGSGKSITNFLNTHSINRECLYIATGSKDCKVDTLAQTNSSGLEKHNSSPILKQLIGFNSNGPIFGKYERDKVVSQVQQEALNVGLKSLKFFKFKKNNILLQDLIFLMNDNYTSIATAWNNKKLKK